MSETPRTDAVMEALRIKTRHYESGKDSAFAWYEGMYAHAKQLEAELANLKKDVANALGAGWSYINGFEERALAKLGITADMCDDKKEDE